MVEGKTDRAIVGRSTDPANHCYLVYAANGKGDIVDALKISKNSYAAYAVSPASLTTDYWLITAGSDVLEHQRTLLYDKCCPDMESLLLNSARAEKVIAAIHLYRFDTERSYMTFTEKLKV